MGTDSVIGVHYLHTNVRERRPKIVGKQTDSWNAAQAAAGQPRDRIIALCHIMRLLQLRSLQLPLLLVLHYIDKYDSCNDGNTGYSPSAYWGEQINHMHFYLVVNFNANTCQ